MCPHVEHALVNLHHSLMSTIKHRTTLFFFSLVVLFCSQSVGTDNSRGNGFGTSDWYTKLPNDNLYGVPQPILQNEKHFPTFKNMLLSVIGKSGHSERIFKEAERRQKTQNIVDEAVSFPCNVRRARSMEKPSSVHAVRPGDIDIVAAMGDSLTAGNGAFALNTPHLTVENRGVCAMIGGQENWRKFLTLPNILKEFNPKLIGYSLGDSFTHHPESQFNVAEIGAMSQDLPYMTRQLVKRIKNDPRVDFENDWKLVTVLIGSNNFCIDICYLDDAFTSVKVHKDNLITSFQYLRDNMPKTIVNFLQSPNLKVIVEFQGVPAKCKLTHLFECPCLFALQHRLRQKEFYEVMNDWQRVEEEIANDQRFKTKEDFTIVLQPFTKNITFPLKRDAITGEVSTDVSYLSDDCFHFSQKGYSRAANALWNNLLEPVGSKSINWLPEFQKFMCPSERSPYIFTWKNSNL